MMNLNTTVKYGEKHLPKIQHKEEGNNIRAFYIDDFGREQLLASIGYGEDSKTVKFSLKSFNALRGIL
jgi:hypothetical protein